MGKNSCRVCGNHRVGKRLRHYCSEECYEIFKKETDERRNYYLNNIEIEFEDNCERCGETVIMTNRQRFCENCRKTGRPQKKKDICKNCQKPITDKYQRIFCSKKCAGIYGRETSRKYNNKHVFSTGKTLYKGTCEKCGKNGTYFWRYYYNTKTNHEMEKLFCLHKEFSEYCIISNDKNEIDKYSEF